MLDLKEFDQLIMDEKKEMVIEWVIKMMNSEELTVRSLYKDYLIPSIGLFECPFQEEPLCIWREHVKTSIVRTIVEVVYPYVLKEKRKAIGKKIIMTCPSQEYHELPLRIVSDWFELNGFHTIFAGGNTPLKSLIKAIEFENPDYLALSVSNTYNLYRMQDLIDAMKKAKKDLKIIVGGIAFEINPEFLKKLPIDFYLKNLDEIDEFSKRIRGLIL
jgi:methanogenic corrinoid protein MtbC1